MVRKYKSISKKMTYQKNKRQKTLKVKEETSVYATRSSKSPQISLLYSGKNTTQSITESIPNVSLTAKEMFGQSRFDNRVNMLVSGDNLAVLKTMLSNPNIAGKVKLIYIDPPFSTNQKFRYNGSRTATISSSHNDEIAYEDNLIGADYLEFLRKRLILLRELLSDNGSIYLHLDYKIGHYVKVLMDEIFGPDRFINDITRIKCNPKNFSRKAYGNIKDMLLFYAKSEHYIWNEPREKISEEDIKKLFPKIDKDGRRYTTTPIHAPGETVNGETGQTWKGLTPPKGRHWRISPDELTRLDKKGLIEWSSTGNPRKKIYLDEALSKGKKRQDIWEFKDHPYPAYPTEKNLEMLKLIVRTSSNPDDLVLDCFSGSGTTLIAAEELKRRWIGIDNSPSAIEVSKKKLVSLKNISAFVLYETTPMRKGEKDEQVGQEKHRPRELTRISG